MTAKLKNILRCYTSGLGIKETANLFHLSRNTVRKYVRLFISSGKTPEQLLSLSEEHLREMFGYKDVRQMEPSQRQLELEALLPGYVARLSRQGMTVWKLFKEYKGQHPDGFQESNFKRAIRQYRFHSKVVGHVEHYAADQMYIDFAGERLEVVDELTGEIKKAEIFVAILPFSHYTYCEAVWSQRKEDLMKERKMITVGKNCYVSLFRHHYCVPREHVGKRVVVLYDADTVEIYCGLNLVATHDRCDIPYTYSWKKEHNLPGHYGPYDKDLEELFKQAADIANIVLNYLHEVDDRMQYPPKSFGSCRGIMSLGKKYGNDRLIAACACASQKSEFGYQGLKEVLEQCEDAEFLPDEDGAVPTGMNIRPMPVHKNIRGQEYYSKNDNQ